MESTIYFFTGTGNSLKVAKDLAEHLGDCELIPIAKIWQRENLASTAQKVGFAFPLYYSGMPKIVYDFIEKIDLTNAEYFFAIVTSAGDVTELPLQQVNMLLKAKSRAKSLNAGFLVTMPNNYIIGFDIHPEQRQKEFFEKEKEQVKNISEIVKNNKGNLNQEIFTKKLNRAERFNAKFREDVNESDKNFYAEDTCTSCAICENICPVHNITIIDGVPKWQHKCQQCLACINFCPEKAIQFGTGTLKTQRYHNPEITIEDISNQKY
jgi:NAD-dependent dihydropyrimidine dehydrogenase PreA subunit/flavodoxin